VYKKKKEGRLEIGTQKGERKNWKKEEGWKKESRSVNEKKRKERRKRKRKKNEGNGGLGTYI